MCHRTSLWGCAANRKLQLQVEGERCAEGFLRLFFFQLHHFSHPSSVPPSVASCRQGRGRRTGKEILALLTAKQICNYALVHTDPSCQINSEHELKEPSDSSALHKQKGQEGRKTFLHIPLLISADPQPASGVGANTRALLSLSWVRSVKNS